MTKKQKIAYYTLLVILTALFLFTAYDKLSGDPMAKAGFAVAGLPVWFMYVIGLGELLGVIGLWIKNKVVFRLAYEGLFLILIGAIVTTVVFVSIPLALLPMATAIVLGIVVRLNSKGRAQTGTTTA